MTKFVPVALLTFVLLFVGCSSDSDLGLLEYPDGDEAVTDGDVEEEVDGDVEEEVDGDVEEEIDGDVEDEVDGDVEDEVDGDDEEETDGDVEEETDGDVEEETDGDVEEETDGDVEEETDGDIEDEQEVEEPLELAGAHKDNWDNGHQVTNTLWTIVGMGTPSVFHITQYSNDTQYVIAQNHATYNFFPDKWSRFDWVEKEGTLYYCQTAYNADSEQLALDATADASDPATTGCGGAFAWSSIEETMEIIGAYTDSSFEHVITPADWSMTGFGSTSVLLFHSLTT